MAPRGKIRTYGKRSKTAEQGRLFAELPQSPVRKPPIALHKPENVADPVSDLTEQIALITVEDKEARPKSREAKCTDDQEDLRTSSSEPASDRLNFEIVLEQRQSSQVGGEFLTEGGAEDDAKSDESSLRVLAWDDVCPFGDQIQKIAEASYAEVYRVTNDRGVSIIKTIRLQSPIKPQTKAQERSGLVDEEPHSVSDLLGELQISEWVADIPGFVVYKERYIVKGKAPKALLETHQAFQRKMKRQDPDRLQFYPSPSRYLEGTKFLVVELGDAGVALEDFRLESSSQLWDILLHVAIAMARAEDLISFEHRDLHEGNLCIRKIGEPKEKDPRRPDLQFGFSGLDITILDYGLSRAEDLTTDDSEPMAYDLEKDLSLFTSTHADQCKVYRQMRSFLLRGDRTWLPPESHDTPYAKGVLGPLSWSEYVPYTNVLWLAYIYEYLTEHFSGDKKDLATFKHDTQELWKHLNPNAKSGIPSFGCAADVVQFAVEAGWVSEEQLMGRDGSTLMAEREDSIILSQDAELEGSEDGPPRVRRSARRRQ